MKPMLGGIALCLALAACNSESDPVPANGAETNAAEANRAEAEGDGNAAAPAFASCPFRRTRDWNGSWEAGRLLVNGAVDVQMAGFKPTLTVRSSEPPVIAFDLALTQEPGAVVSDTVRYERPGAPLYRQAEIWCGGERVKTLDLIVVE